MCFRNETLCCMVWNVFYCLHFVYVPTQSGSDQAATQSLVPILKVVCISA